MSFYESKSKRAKLANRYTGYCISENDEIAVSTNPVTFYDDFIECRRPALLKHAPPVDIANFKLSSLEERLRYTRPLQVERKHAFGFGLGTRRELMTLTEIVQKLRQGDDTYYLTTQYEIDPKEEDVSQFSEDSNDKTGFGESASGISTWSGELSKQNDDNSSGDSDFPEEFYGVDDYDELIELENGYIAKYSSDGEGQDIVHNAIEYAVPKYKITHEEAEYRVKSLLQPPLTNALQNGTFPIVPSQFHPLVTQQINLWMGSAVTSDKPALIHPTVENLGNFVPRGNSSGLHHDHADNLYILTEGLKRFTLYLPADAGKLFTVGHINLVYENGLIDYHTDENSPSWRPLRADGAIISDWAQWKLQMDGISKEMKQELHAIVSKQESALRDNEQDSIWDSASAKLDPPSFSRVPPILAHLDEIRNFKEKKALEEFAEKYFPGFLGLKKLEVWLKPGDMLYLPAGWFHEVTSFGATNGSQHVALNWWFVPPTGQRCQPYEDDYWLQDFQATLASVEWARKKNQDKQS